MPERCEGTAGVAAGEADADAAQEPTHGISVYTYITASTLQAAGVPERPRGEAGRDQRRGLRLHCRRVGFKRLEY